MVRILLHAANTILNRDAHTNVGDSEYPGGETVYCSAKAKTSPLQGDLAPNFWSNVEFVSKTGVNGQAYVQRAPHVPHSSLFSDFTWGDPKVTGCINAGTLDRISPDDAGGQYDSSGGDGGLGNPRNSVCTGCASLKFTLVKLPISGQLTYSGRRYNHYVEFLEPRGPRACIRCCIDPADCPVTMGEFII